MVNMFTNAPLVVRAKPKSRKAAKEQVALAGLETYAALDRVITTLSTLRDTLHYDLNGAMTALFIERGLAAKRRPANFQGVDGSAKASCELRKRSTRSGLDDASLSMLSEAGIDTLKVHEVVDTFVINPEYIGDSRLLARISKALDKVPGIPADFIQHQVGVSRYVVGEDALSQVFAKERSVLETLLPLVGVLALKATMSDGTRAHAIVADLLNTDDAEE